MYFQLSLNRFWHSNYFTFWRTSMSVLSVLFLPFHSINQFVFYSLIIIISHSIADSDKLIRTSRHTRTSTHSLSLITVSSNTLAHMHPCTQRHVRETIALDSVLEDGGRIICQSCSGITVRFFRAEVIHKLFWDQPRALDPAHRCRAEGWQAVRNSSLVFTNKDHTLSPRSRSKISSHLMALSCGIWYQISLRLSARAHMRLTLSASWCKVRSNRFHLFLAVRILSGIKALSLARETLPVYCEWTDSG